MRWGRRLLGALLGLVLLASAGVVLAHVLVIDTTAREVRATGLIPEGMSARVLVVLARPGQEVPMSGTIRALDEAGVEVAILALTSGEAQPPDLDTADLAAIRADELAASADALGAGSATTAGFPDGELVTIEPAQVLGRIAEAIRQSTPSIVLTVTDATGTDADSQAVAAYATTAAGAPDSGVARVWTVTRGEREALWSARLAGAAPAPVRLPEPDLAVPISAHAIAKGEALAAHGTQSPHLVAGTYPFADRAPAWAYFRFLDREYFSLAWGVPLD